MYTHVVIEDIGFIVSVSITVGNISGRSITYIFVVIECVKHVIRQTAEEVYDEPTFEVIRADDFRVGDHFASGSDEGRVEIENDIYEEDDVDDGIDNEERDVLGRLVLEGHIIRHHDGGIKGEAKNDPVPDRFESAVVEEDVRRRLRGFLPVLREDVCAQAHHLENATGLNARITHSLRCFAKPSAPISANGREPILSLPERVTLNRKQYH